MMNIGTPPEIRAAFLFATWGARAAVGVGPCKEGEFRIAP